jgi:hypothetical protein
MHHPPTDFARSARRSAKAAWLLAVLAAILWWLLGWKWGAAAGVVALWNVISSASSTHLQSLLEETERTAMPLETQPEPMIVPPVERTGSQSLSLGVDQHATDRKVSIS